MTKTAKKYCSGEIFHKKVLLRSVEIQSKSKIAFNKCNESVIMINFLLKKNKSYIESYDIHIRFCYVIYTESIWYIQMLFLLLFSLLKVNLFSAPIFNILCDLPLFLRHEFLHLGTVPGSSLLF